MYLRTVDQVDTYFGTAVPDPYRWLEDDNAPETARWVEAQNAVTDAYLDKIPFRASLEARLEKLYDSPHETSPTLVVFGAMVRRRSFVCQEGIMAETDETAQAEPVADAEVAADVRPDGVELTDEQLDKVSGGQGAEFTSVSNVLKTRHDTAKNSISNLR